MLKINIVINKKVISININFNLQKSVKMVFKTKVGVSFVIQAEF